MPETVLEAENIRAGYGKSVIVDDVSITLSREEIVAIVGPNGSGKSTLIKAIYGLANLFEGVIRFNGREITLLPPEAKARIGIGYVPQTENIFPDLKVEENLEMGAIPTTDKREARRELQSIYDMFPILLERRKEKASVLSGGEKQMLAIARALMGSPRVLILDEPTASLAPKVVSDILKKIDLIRRRNVSIILIEQHAKKALQLADRGYVLSAGKGVMQGSGREILANEDMIRAFLGRK